MTTLQQPAPTFDDVWRTIQELALLNKETERLMKEGAAETERRFQETERLMKEGAAESERRFQETERLMKEGAAETERRFQETEQLMKEGAAETERKFQETERRFQETERLVKEGFAETNLLVSRVSKNLGELGNRLGEFVEHMVEPAVVRLFQAQGIAVHEVHQNVAVERDGEGVEIDLLVVNDGVLVAVECKSKLSNDHVDAHLARMAKFKRLLPTFRNHQALGAVAAMVMSKEVRDYAHSQGLYVLYQSGENVEISTPVGFTPKIW